MIINTQLITNDMDSDYEDAAGDMIFNSNIYVEIKGATPSQRTAIRAIMRETYNKVRSELYSARN